MNNVSATVKMMGNLQAAIAEMLTGVMEERGRGFASDREAWAELKERIEITKSMANSLEKLHKEMWDAVKDHNGDAFCALSQEFERASARMAAEWTTTAVMGKIAVELTDE